MEKDILWTNRYFMIYFEYVMYVMYVEYQGLCGVSVCFISIGFCFFFQDRDLHPELSWSGIRGSHSKKVAGSKGNKGIVNPQKIPSTELNICPKNGILKMIFLFPRWDMLIPWRVFYSSKFFWKHHEFAPNCFVGCFPEQKLRLRIFWKHTAVAVASEGCLKSRNNLTGLRVHQGLKLRG